MYYGDIISDGLDETSIKRWDGWTKRMDEDSSVWGDASPFYSSPWGLQRTEKACPCFRFPAPPWPSNGAVRATHANDRTALSARSSLPDAMPALLISITDVAADRATRVMRHLLSDLRGSSHGEVPRVMPVQSRELFFLPSACLPLYSTRT